MKSISHLTITMIVALAVTVSLIACRGSRANESEPLPPGQDIFDLYGAGKLEAARKAAPRARIEGVRGRIAR